MKTKIPDGGAAFPQPGVIHFDRERQMFECVNPINGMSLRDYFASITMLGEMIRESAGKANECGPYSGRAWNAYNQADAMLKERDSQRE